MFLSLALTFTFAGGEGTALTKQIAEHWQESAVFSHEPSTKIPKISFEFKDREEFRTSLTKVTQLSASENEDNVLSTPGYPLHLVLANGHFKDDTWKKAGEIRISDRRVSTSPDGSFLSVASLQFNKFQKPLKVHWFLQEQWVSIYARDERESELLRKVSAAVGGSFYESPTEYRIEFDPKEFRRRAIFTWTAAGNQDSFAHNSADNEYTLAVYKMISDEQIAKVYEKPDSQVTLPLDIKSGIYSVAMKRLNRTFNVKPDGRISSGASEAYSWVQNNVDFTKSGQILLEPKRRPGTLLPVKNKPEGHWFRY